MPDNNPYLMLHLFFLIWELDLSENKQKTKKKANTRTDKCKNARYMETNTESTKRAWRK